MRRVPVMLLSLALVATMLVGCVTSEPAARTCKMDADKACACEGATGRCKMQGACKADQGKTCECKDGACMCKKTAPAVFCLRVNCGADDAYQDKAGNEWVADQMMFQGMTWGAEDGDIALRNEVDIAGTDCPKIYLAERFGMSAYTFQVPDGKYAVTLHFAETYDDIYGAGERVFSVSINGEEKITDFDPYKAGGGLFKPTVKSFKSIEAKDGKIVVGFKENIQSPEINGIEVVAE